MNKAGLVEAVVAGTELSKKEATAVVELVFGTVTETLEKGEPVDIHGFGKFDVRERAARDGVNPLLLKKLKEQGVPEAEAKEQAKIRIEASKTVGFKAKKALKDAVK